MQYQPSFRAENSQNLVERFDQLVSFHVFEETDCSYDIETSIRGFREIRWELIISHTLQAELTHDTQLAFRPVNVHAVRRAARFNPVQKTSIPATQIKRAEPTIGGN